MKRTKKIICIFLTAALLIGIVPAVASNIFAPDYVEWDDVDELVDMKQSKQIDTIVFEESSDALRDIRGSGILPGGAPWTLFYDGVLEIGSGGIDVLWRPMFGVGTGAWGNAVEFVERIIITGEVSAGPRLSGLFASLFNLTDIEGLDYFDTSAVTDMSLLFYGTTKLTNLDLSSWYTGNVTNMSGMFTGTSSLTNLNIGNWDTSKVTHMSSMFEGAYYISSLDIGGWDIGSVTTMNQMFYGVGARSDIPTTIDLSNWDTGNVRSMGEMFRDSNLQIHGLSNWNTENVTSIGAMFENTRFADTDMDLSNWDISNVSGTTGIGRVFSGSNITSLDISGWDTRNMVGIFQFGRMFENTNYLRELTLGENFRFLANPGLAHVQNNETYTGFWIHTGSGETRTSVQLMENDFTPGTWMWQTHYGQWEIGFDAMGGIVSPEVGITRADGRLIYLPTPTKTGYTFEGWFTEAVGGNLITTATVFTSDNIIFAQWEAIENPQMVTVMFEGPRETVGTLVGETTAKVPIGGSLTAEQIPTPVVTSPSRCCGGWLFGGWRSPQFCEWRHFSSDCLKSLVITETTVFFADFGMLTVHCAITFLWNYDREGFNAFAWFSGHEPFPPSPPSREGFKFLGWTTDAAGYNAFDIDIDLEYWLMFGEGCIYVYAQWEKYNTASEDVFQLTIRNFPSEERMGMMPGEMTVRGQTASGPRQFNSPLNLKPGIVAFSHFLGWATSESNFAVAEGMDWYVAVYLGYIIELTLDHMPAHDLTVYAVWGFYSIHARIVTVGNLPNHVRPPDQTLRKLINTDDITEPITIFAGTAPERYDFLGWVEVSAFPAVGDNVNQIPGLVSSRTHSFVGTWDRGWSMHWVALWGNADTGIIGEPRSEWTPPAELPPIEDDNDTEYPPCDNGACEEPYEPQGQYPPSNGDGADSGEPPPGGNVTGSPPIGGPGWFGGGAGQGVTTVVEMEEEDVPLAEMNYDGIHYAFMIGFEDGTVRPMAEVTRAQMATMLLRVMSDEQRTRYWTWNNPFADVPEDSWFNNAVSTITNAGIMVGASDDLFMPNRAVTRAELAATIVRHMGAAPVVELTQFNDIAGHWAENYINAAAYNGWFSSSIVENGGQFEPDRVITRAEAASVINRALGRMPYNPEALLPGMRTWPDNANPDTWYYLYMQIATNSQRATANEDGIRQAWTELIGAERNWRLLERFRARPEDILPEADEIEQDD